MTAMPPSLRKLKPIRIWSFGFVAAAMLSLQGCGGVTLLAHDYCLRDTLIILEPDVGIEGTVMETDILAHNARLECGCSEPPGWCEDL